MPTLLGFDTDNSPDDIIAKLLALATQEIQVVFDNVAGTGENHPDPGAENAATLLQMLQMSHIPVGKGKDESTSDNPFPADFRDSIDKIFEGIPLEKIFKIDVSTAPKPIIHSSAVELMKKVMDEHPNEKITILATGPLTNIAGFIKKYPNDIDRIERIVMMGGAIIDKGNLGGFHPLTKNDAGECNVVADIEAAETVFNSELKIVMVPLDATNQLPLTRDYYFSLENSKHPAIQLMYALLTKIIEECRKLAEQWNKENPTAFPTNEYEYFEKYFYLWDPTATEILRELLRKNISEKENEGFAKAVRMKISIDPKTGKTNGTPADDGNVLVIMKINQPKEDVLKNIVTTIEKGFMDKNATVTDKNTVAFQYANNSTPPIPPQKNEERVSDQQMRRGN